MKSSSTCEVEISITMDGEETVESVPECLQGAVLSTPGDAKPETQEHVTLPLRYTQMLNCTDCEKQRVGDNMLDREKDLHTALKWIKQEIMLMKEQDKVLIKQFINLRSRIVQLRCLYEMNSSNSDISQDGSSFSLDELRSCSPYSLQNGYLGNPELEMTEFRARTTSLLSPRGRKWGPVTKIKWKSNEYI